MDSSSGRLSATQRFARLFLIALPALAAALVLSKSTAQRETSADVLKGTVGGWTMAVTRSGLVRYSRGTSTLAFRSVSEAGSSKATSRMEAGALEIPAATGFERFALSSAGVEQTFHFNEPPVRDRPLEITVQVEGALSGHPDRNGIVFTTADGELRYGAATWVDATQRRWPIAEEWRRGELRLHVPAEIVSQSKFPAVLDPLIGPDVEIDTDTAERGPSPGRQDSTSAALSGSKWMVAWSSGVRPSDADVRWTLVDGQRSPTLTAEAPRTIIHAMNPAVATHRNGWFMAYAVGDPGSVHFGTVAAVRIQPDGTVQDATPIVLGSFPGEDSRNVAADCSPSQCLAAWSSGQGSKLMLRARRFDAVAGVALGPIINLSGDSASVAWNGTAFLVTAAPLTMMSESGAVTQAPSGCSMGGPAAASSSTGGGYVTWIDASGQIYGSRVSADGTLLDGCAHVVAARAGWTWMSAPSVAARGSGFLVSWKGYRLNSWSQDRAAVAIDSAGVPGAAFRLAALDQGKAIVLATGGGAAMSCSADECLLVAPTEARALAWDNPFAAHSSSIRALRIDATNHPIDAPLLLSADAVAQSKPSAGFEGSHFLLSWEEPAAEWRVRAAWLSTAGAVEVPPFSFGATAERGRSPTVSCGSGQCFVAWREEHDGGESVQAGWASLDGGWQDALDGGWPVAPDESTGGVDSVLSAPETALVAWDTGTEVKVATVSGLQASVQQTVGTARMGAGIYAVRMGATPSFAAVLWLEGMLDGSNSWLWMRRLSPSGQWMDAQPQLVVTGGLSAPAAMVAQSSGDLLVLLRSSTAESVTVPMSGAPTVSYGAQNDHARYVDPTAAIFDGSAVRIASTVSLAPGPEHATTQMGVGLSEGIADWTSQAALQTTGPLAEQATLATDGRGHSLLAYSTYDERPSVSTMRIHARLISADASCDDCPNEEIATSHCGCSTGAGGMEVFALCVLVLARRSKRPS